MYIYIHIQRKIYDVVGIYICWFVVACKGFICAYGTTEKTKEKKGKKERNQNTIKTLLTFSIQESIRQKQIMRKDPTTTLNKQSPNIIAINKPN